MSASTGRIQVRSAHHWENCTNYCRKILANCTQNVEKLDCRRKKAHDLLSLTCSFDLQIHLLLPK